MNTTTNTRGLSEAMVDRACEASWPIAKFSCELSDWKQIGSGPRREHHTNVVRAALEAALSAPEPAAQGEALSFKERVALEVGADEASEDDILSHVAAWVKAAKSAPPAQPAERGGKGVEG